MIQLIYQCRPFTEVIHIGLAVREQVPNDKIPSGFERIKNCAVCLESLFSDVVKHKIRDREIIPNIRVKWFRQVVL